MILTLRLTSLFRTLKVTSNRYWLKVVNSIQINERTKAECLATIQSR